MTETVSIHNPTTWSDFDFLEFEGFVSKVENEGFTYAAENYGPDFESPELQAAAADLGSLRRLYLENEAKVDDWYEQVGPRCGNNPNVRLSPGDRKAVEEFRAYLKRRAAGGPPERHLGDPPRP